MKVSFDFNDTLTRKDVQGYAKELVADGVDVYIHTDRLKNSKQLSLEHQQVKDVAKKVGIPEDNIVYCGNSRKHKELDKNFLWHLDDTKECIYYIDKHTDVTPVLLKDNWKKKCNGILNQRKTMPWKGL